MAHGADSDILEVKKLVPINTKASVRLYSNSPWCLHRCKDCDGAASRWQPQWEVTQEAAQWERRLGWPPDPQWTESNWPTTQPYLQLYQVSPRPHTCYKSFKGIPRLNVQGSM